MKNEMTGYWLLTAAAIGDLAIPFLLAPFYEGYSHRTMVMSILGNKNCPVHLIYRLWLILAGGMFLWGGAVWYTRYVKVSGGIAGALLGCIAIYAVGACILSGFFSVGETKEMTTLSQRIHGIGSVLGFFALVFAPLLTGLLAVKEKDVLTGIFCFGCFVLAVLFFALFVMADKEKFSCTVIASEGLWQRLSLFSMYGPLLLVSVKTLMEGRSL